MSLVDEQHAFLMDLARLIVHATWSVWDDGLSAGLRCS
jgi:hypothetical protein